MDFDELSYDIHLEWDAELARSKCAGSCASRPPDPPDTMQNWIEFLSAWD